MFSLIISVLYFPVISWPSKLQLPGTDRHDVLQWICAENKIFRSGQITIELIRLDEFGTEFSFGFSVFRYQFTLEISLKHLKIFQILQQDKIC